MNRPLNEQATISLAKDFAALEKAGRTHELSATHPLGKELISAGGLTPIQVTWFVKGFIYGREDYESDLRRAETEAFDEIIRHLDPNARRDTNPWKAPVGIAPECIKREVRRERVAKLVTVLAVIALGWTIVSLLVWATVYAIEHGGLA